MRQVKREKTVKLKYHFESIQSEETPATKGEDVTEHKIDTHEKGSYYEKHGTKHNGGGITLVIKRDSLCVNVKALGCGCCCCNEILFYFILKTVSIMLNLKLILPIVITLLPMNCSFKA